MFRIIQWVLSICLAIGAGDAFVRLTLEMCQAAVHAHQNRQMSYAKFTRAMVNAKPRRPHHESVDRDEKN